MTSNEARNIFNAAIASNTDADQIAKIELCREYFTNPEFRAALEAHTFAASQNG